MLSSTLTLLVVLPLIQEPRAQADPAPGRISGRVVGPLATPIGKARVELYASGASEATRVVETRSSGWFGSPDSLSEGISCA